MCDCLVLQLQSAEVSRTVTMYEAGRSVLMLMKESKIPRIELSTVHLYQHYSLFMLNKLQYTWCGDYCECVRPAQLTVLTEVRAPSLLEQYPRYVPHRDRSGYNTTKKRLSKLDLDLLLSIFCFADPSGRAFKGSAISRIWGLRFRIPSVCFECCLLSDRCLSDGQITRPDEICRVWCVWVWLWNLIEEA
jgi:hypothetical protein